MPPWLLDHGHLLGMPQAEISAGLGTAAVPVLKGDVCISQVGSRAKLPRPPSVFMGLPLCPLQSPPVAHRGSSVASVATGSELAYPENSCCVALEIGLTPACETSQGATSMLTARQPAPGEPGLTLMKVTPKSPPPAPPKDSVLSQSPTGASLAHEDESGPT